MLTKDVSTPMRIVGAQFAGALDLVANLCVGEELELVSEPNNKFDTNAVMVFYQGHKLGYIERAIAPQVRLWMAKGHIIRIIVSRNDPRNDLYNMLWCVIEHYKVVDPSDTLGPVLSMSSKAADGEKHVWRIHQNGVSYTRLDTNARPYRTVEVRMEPTDISSTTNVRSY